MKKTLRRDRLKIYSDLLSILSEFSAKTVVLTHVQLKINVPFDRMNDYISELRELGLINEDLKLTDKGKQYIREYRVVADFMDRMGLIYQKTLNCFNGLSLRFVMVFSSFFLRLMVSFV